jgi:HEAT repeat protein
MSTSIVDLLQQLKQGDAQQVVDAANALFSLRDPRGVKAAIDVLLSTDDPTVRDALALSVSDHKHPEGFEALVTLLQDEHTRGHRGTLLYALAPYDCSAILLLLIDFAVTGSFEVSQQALNLIDGIDAEIDEQTWQEGVRRLRQAYANASEERRPAIAELLERFELTP